MVEINKCGLLEMDEKKKIKICFAASSGGHYEQLMMLKPLMKKYDRTGSRNSRIDSLCQQLNLESRRYDGDIFKVQTQIDYNKVNHLREERRKESLQYLTTALKGEITIG